MYWIPLQLVPLRSRSVHKIKELDPRFHESLAWAGLLPFVLMMAGAPMEGGGRTPLPPIEVSLLIGLFDHWRPEMHMFHFPCGEMTVTLQDVAMVIGLPIRGIAVGGLTPIAGILRDTFLRFGRGDVSEYVCWRNKCI